MRSFLITNLIVIPALWVGMSCAKAWADARSLNDFLPKSWKERLDVGIELRHRFEFRDNFDFNDAADDEDGFHLLRTRMNVDFNAAEYLGAYLQLQDSRIWESEFSDKTPYQDDLDIRQGYIEVKGKAGAPLAFRIGRQELSYGDQRLVGGFNWSNVAQSFDAVKVIYDAEDFGVDAFASRKAVIGSNSFNEWDDDDNFYGAYSTYEGVDKHAIDFYYFFRDADRDVAFGPNVGTGRLDESTVGLRVVGKKLGGFDYGLEAAYQFGDFGSQDIEAFAVVVLAGHTFYAPWSARLSFEWDHASGDGDSGDGERNTFDNLYPTNHMHYGYMDRASLQNIDDLRFSVSAKPAEKLKLQADLHLLYLDEVADSLYDAGRKAIRTTADSSVDDHVGTELDLLLKYIFDENIEALLGYSHFFTGGYLKDTGAADGGDFFYIQTTVYF